MQAFNAGSGGTGCSDDFRLQPMAVLICLIHREAISAQRVLQPAAHLYLLKKSQLFSRMPGVYKLLCYVEGDADTGCCYYPECR